MFRLCGLRFALCPRGFSRFAASDESSTPLLIGLTTACFRHRRRPSCAPLQFPLKSCGFSGAETARKRFLLWKMGFSAAKIAPSPPYTPPGTIKARKGFGSTIRHGRSASLASSLAVLPASLGLLRAVSPTGRALRAPLSRSPGIFGSLRNRVKTTTIFSQPPRNADKIHLYSELFLMKSTTSSTMQCAMQMTVSAPP